METLRNYDGPPFGTQYKFPSFSLEDKGLLLHIKGLGKRVEIKENPVFSYIEIAGEIMDIGAQMTSFHPGDQIYGIATISSSIEECHYIDGRCVALMPSFLEYAQAATLPFMGVQAYHILFNQLKITSDIKQNILIVGGEKRISKLLLSLIKTLTRSRVFITYDNEGNKKYVEKEKADGFLNTAETFLSPLKQLNLPYFDSIFSTTEHKHLFAEYKRILRPFGEVCLIENDEECQTLRPHFLPFSDEEQGQILQHLSRLITQQKIPYPATFSL